MPLSIEINPQFSQALDLINNSSKHLFITGKAGSGKSTLLNYALNHCPKNIAVIAPTGIAALNVHGQTIHRFFNFPINVTPEKITSFRVTPRVKRLYKNLETLIIDEVSMLRADLFDCINSFLKIYGPEPQKAFGGVQIVLVGDLYQLPPVIGRDESIIFSSRYQSPYFFGADSFKEISLKVIELTKIYRQKDTAFINLLSRIRANTADATDLQTLNSRLISPAITLPASSITVTTTNNLANKINQQRLNALNGVLYTSSATIDGTFAPEYFPTSENLQFKIGAQIMFLNNDAKGRWVNGTLGMIEAVKQTEDKIRYLSVRITDNSRLVEVFPYSWEIFRFKLKGQEIISDIVGSFMQFPLRLAWAVTIHKSQGQTFEHISIDIGTGTFAAGQLYVALSRCTSLQGISLQKPLAMHHIICDSDVCNFMQDYLIANDDDFAKRQKFIKAARLHQKLQINYHKKDGTISQRIIIPLHLKGDNLLAFCTQRNQQRTFTVSRITDIQNFYDD